MKRDARVEIHNISFDVERIKNKISTQTVNQRE